MLRWFLRRRLDAEEKKLGESLEYLRHILDVSRGAFLRFASIMPFANSRKTLPKEAWFAAQVAATQHHDCGPCVQIVVNLAKEEGVDRKLLRAVLDNDTEALPPLVADVLRFSRSIVTASEDDAALRERLRSEFGERGLIEMAYAIASCAVPPTVKRTLGYATSCAAVSIDV